MTKADMTALAERLEAATGDDADLFWSAFEATIPALVFNLRPWPDEFRARERRFNELIEAKAFESAAMLLVPEGWHPSFIIRQAIDACITAVDQDRKAFIRRLPAFIAAAAIRARASQEDE